jgi:C4-type Zn-finger protein
MQKVTCPICNAEFDLPEGAKEGDQVTCPICGADLKLVIENGELSAETV